MKAIILSAIMICLMLGAKSAYALTAYDSGFKEGFYDELKEGISS
jgi:hypothetical protein